MHVRILRRRLPAALLCALLAACGGESPRDPRPLVVVSVVPQRFVVDALAGELVRVEVMVPPGASPHTWEPTLAQLRALEEAALYVKVGHPNFRFETIWLGRILADLPGLEVIDASSGLGAPAEGSADDPHVWLVPRHVGQTAVRVERALEEILPGHETRLRTALAAFLERTEALDRELRATLAPWQGGEFFVFHPGWGYFAREYGLRQVAVEHEHKQPDPHELAERIRHAKQVGARVIFVQPQFDRTSAETIAREAGARVEVLDPLAGDWDANLRRAARALADGFAR